MKLVVKLDAANPHQLSAASPLSRGNSTSSLHVLSPRAYYMTTASNNGTSFVVDDSSGDDQNSDNGEIKTMTPNNSDNNNNNNNKNQSSVVVGNNGPKKILVQAKQQKLWQRNPHQQQHPHQSRQNQQDHQQKQQQQFEHNVMDPNEDKPYYNLVVDGPAIVITPGDKRAVQHNRQTMQTLAGRVDNLDETMQNQMTTFRRQQRTVQDELLRINQSKAAKQQNHSQHVEQMLQPQQDQLRGRFVSFVNSETEAQESGRHPVLGEFLDQLQQLQALRQSRQFHRQDSFTNSSNNAPPGVGANFDGSYINVNQLGGATAPVSSEGTVPNGWQLPSWVTRQGYTSKQQLLIQKAQQQLTPILKQQRSKSPVFSNSRLAKSPSTKRVSWSEQVDSIPIPVHSNGDKPLRKPGRRQRSLSPSAKGRGHPLLINNGKVIIEEMDDDDDYVMTARRTPRPGSSEAAILDRLGHNQQKIIVIEAPAPFMKRSQNNNTSRHRHIARLRSSTNGIATLTAPLMNSGPFGVLPPSDDASTRASRMRSALQRISSSSDEDVTVLRRWRSLEAVLQRRNMNQQLAQIRHRAHVNSRNSALVDGAPVRLYQRNYLGGSINNLASLPKRAPSPTSVPGVNLLRVAKLDPDSYHVSLGIRLPATTGQHRLFDNPHHLFNGGLMTAAISAGR